ncbi:MAG: hypothetical protein PHU23_12850 [Dehalococcoidales bacterium]|nr:hypothetical protein [Dehalococcoidales bacterium]
MTSRERATREDADPVHLGSVSSPPDPSERPNRIHNSSYLELVDKIDLASENYQYVNYNDILNNPEISHYLSNTCDLGKGYVISGECEDGHRYAKEIVCGKEWCRICGQDDSSAHNRRFVRWLPKIQQFPTMGYFVFTIPENIRDRFRTKNKLNELRSNVHRILKSRGFTGGLSRYHWFGDRSTKYHPHLNVLVEGGHIPGELIESIKSEYAGLLGVDVVSVNYHYRPSPGKMLHSLKYVTRATFLEASWDFELALELRGFRNMVPWGDLRGKQTSDNAAWTMDKVKTRQKKLIEGMNIEAIQKIGEGVCPVCGKYLEWNKDAIPVQLLKEVNKVSYGAGYWRLDDIPQRYREVPDHIPKFNRAVKIRPPK